MTALSISAPFTIFSDVDGDPLDSGYIYIGAANQNPVTNPITVYWDAALTIPAAQPIRTSGGYPQYNGTAANLYANSDYSIRVTNKNGTLVYSAASATARFSDVVVSGVDSSEVSYLPAGTGAVATTVQGKLRESVSVKDFGAGMAAFTQAVAAIGSNEQDLIVNDNITVDVNFSVPQNITLRVQRGAQIAIDTGVTLTVLGEIAAGNYVIFSGAGTLDLNAGSAYFNLSWFDGQYLNDKWDFVLRGLVSLRPYTVFVPKPEKGMQGAVEVASNLVYWGIDAPLLFPDKANGGQWIVGPDARIKAVSAVDSMMEFSTDSKIEDVTFTTGLWLDGGTNATYGMKFRGGSRIRSNGMVQITDCGTLLYFDDVGGSNDKINLNSLYLARWTTSAIYINGGPSDAMVSSLFPEVIMEVPASNLTNPIVVRGSTRSVTFGKVFYQDGGAALTVNNLVLIQSTSNGYSLGLKFDEVYSASAVNTLVKIENSGGSQRAISTSFGKLNGGTTAASLNYDIYTYIDEKPSTPVVYGSDCQEPKANTSIITRTYDFAVSGGAAGTYNLGGSLPNGCTVIRAWYRVEQAFTSSGSATLRLGTTGTLAGIQAILIYTDAAWSVGVHDGIPNGTAATALPQITNSTTFPSFVIANAPITAGKLTMYMEILS